MYCSILNLLGVLCGDYDERFAIRRSIRVNPKKCVLHFIPGRTYTRKIKLLNTTARPQIIRILPPQLENKIFKFPDQTTVKIGPNNSWSLQYTFTTTAHQEFNGYLHLKNITDGKNLAVELRAIPESDSSLPRTINFGNVDTGKIVTRKLHLEPKPYPYRFRIFIPYAVDGLSVMPICGEVSGDTPTEITIVYKPRLYITLCANLILYVSNDDQKPRVVSLTAVTKPKTKTYEVMCLQPVEKTSVNVHIPAPRKLVRPADKTENDVVLFNRHTLNKILMNKHSTMHRIQSHTWLSPLRESDNVYRQLYTENRKNFMAQVKRFGAVHNRAVGSKISRCEPIVTDEEMKYVIDNRYAEWDAYKEKLYSHWNISRDDQSESLGFRERSIRMNHIDKSEYDFDETPDGNWWIRFQMYNKFVNAVKIIIIKNRLVTRLNLFNELRTNNLII